MISDWMSRQGDHTVEVVSACSQSIYVECKCGEKIYAGTERDARFKHQLHRSGG